MANLPEVCLLECLMPPPGYSLESVVGSTYSLSPSILLAMLVAATTPRLGDEGFTLEDRSKEEILHAIHEGSSKCLVFCDHHGTLQENGSLSPHEKLILNAVIKKEGRANNSCGSLHGKVLVSLFKDGKGAYRGRVYVGSKNFTHASYDEFGFVAEFEQTKSARSDAFSSGLESYLHYLHEWEATRVKVLDKLRPLRTTLGILKSRRFRCVVPNAQFHWQGRFLETERAASWSALGDAARQWLDGRSPDSVYIHSPWVRKGALDHLMALCGDTTRFFLRCLDDTQLAISGDKRVAYEFYHGSDGNLEPHHSHAKIYLFKWQREALLAFGSANFTPDGWGLPVSTCRPNCEVLVAVPGPFAAFKQLANIHGQPVNERSAAPREQDAIDNALDYLSGIRVEFDYDDHQEKLCYIFRLPDRSPDQVTGVEISQDLVEPLQDRDHVEIWREPGLPAEGPVRVDWEKHLLYLLSPVMRIRDRQTGAEVHVVLDLELRFFNGKEKLKCLTYTTAEFVRSLARLMEFPMDGHTNGAKRGDDDDDAVVRFVHALRLERYLYRMGKLKHQTPAEFHATISRVESLLRLKPNDRCFDTSPCKEAIDAIERCHRVLHEA